MSDEHLPAAGHGDRRELLAECRFSNARLTNQQNQSAVSLASSVKRRPELSQFGIAANEWRPLRYPLPGLLPPRDLTRTRRSVARRHAMCCVLYVGRRHYLLSRLLLPARGRRRNTCRADATYQFPEAYLELGRVHPTPERAGRQRPSPQQGEAGEAAPMTIQHSETSVIPGIYGSTRTPEQSLNDIAQACAVSRCLHVVAELGLADVLDDTPASVVKLASAVDADADALGSVLRLLSAYGVFEARDGTVAHTPLSRLLRTDHPRSMRAFIRCLGLLPFWSMFGGLMHTVRTGRPAMEMVHPEGLWDHLVEHPEMASIFNSAMAAKARDQVAGVLASYDFYRFRSVCDIGGGHGHLLRAVVDQTAEGYGVLFDLPHVIEEARGLGTSESVRLQAGNFFHDALPVCELYLVMEVIHDWPDADALAILKAIRHAAPVGATLLIIERLIPDEPGPHPAKVMDVAMLALAGGKQRTREQYASLLDRVGFALERVIDTGAEIVILEATAC